MKNRRCAGIALLFILASASAHVSGQGTSAGSIAGTISDPSDAVIPGADVLVRNDATGQEFRTFAAGNGTYNIPSVPAGTYTVTISTAGFKQAVIREVKVYAATPATVHARLEIGVPNEKVIVTSGEEVLQTQTATVTTTIIGRQITELPFTSRDAIDLVLHLPGTTTPGRPRTSSINGLPNGALNVTLDGVNAQDNLTKSGGGFFPLIRPRIDATEEVTVSTAAPGAESSSEGAAHIKFVTRAGSNEYHGSLYEYHRNPSLNANTFFNNRDLPPDPGTGKAPRERILLNQFGFRLGGPIRIPKLFHGRDRAFFFVNYEEFQLPEQLSRTRTILAPEAQNGIFSYGTGSAARSVDLLALAASKAQTSTTDPIVARLLQDIRNATKGLEGGIKAASDPNLQTFTFISSGGQVRQFPTVRFDFNLTKKHHLENTWNYQKLLSKIDLAYPADPVFPGFPNWGSQVAHRFSNVIGLRSTLTANLVNDARFGLTGGTLVLWPEMGPSNFSGPVADQGGFNLILTPAGITSATANNQPERRNSPLKQFSDTLTWARASHSMNFGFNFTHVSYFDQYPNRLVPDITFGVDATDPADVLIAAANFPNSSAADRDRARGIYAVLTGRVIGVAAAATLNEKTGKYEYLGLHTERGHMREMGIFAQDSWRAQTNLTLNYGLRWEVQYPFVAVNRCWSKTAYAELYGISGPGNLFKPGTLAGKETEFTLFAPGEAAYPTKYNNFAPSFGLAWSPKFRNRILAKVFGSGNQTVLRGGYSIAYVREGMWVLAGIIEGNPGPYYTLTRSPSIGNLGTMPLLFRQTERLSPPPFPETPSYPLMGEISNAARAFDPNLRLGYVQSWTFGLQREITKDMVLELRYVGNHGTRLWRRSNLNETNLIENGMSAEFKLAMANLQSNIAAGRGNTFGYFGAGTGTSPLPITLAYFTGTPLSGADDPNKYKGVSGFTSSSWVNPLYPGNPAPLTYANNLHSAATRRSSALAAGLPPNFFMVNPGKRGGANVIDNGLSSLYDALTIELRRRMAHGLLLQGSYTFGKALSNAYGAESALAYGYLTLRHTGLNKTLSPWNIAHSFKANWIWELPMARGKLLFSNAGGVLDRIIGGWGFHGAVRIQSGSPFNLGNINLAGMTVQDLRSAVHIRQDDLNRYTYWLPKDIIDNTRKAFSVTATGYSMGAPAGRYIAPASTAGCIARFNGECGYSNLILSGPRFTRFDLSAVKRIKLTEKANFELRAEFLNAFNNINFMVTGAASVAGAVSDFTSPSFGQTLQSYRDSSTTNDPGCRIIQFVVRINF